MFSRCILTSLCNPADDCTKHFWLRTNSCWSCWASFHALWELNQLVHIWFQSTKRTTDVAWRLKLRQSNATHAIVLSSCIQGPVFAIFSCFSSQPKYVSVYVLSTSLLYQIESFQKRPHNMTIPFMHPNSLPICVPTAWNMLFIIKICCDDHVLWRIELCHLFSLFLSVHSLLWKRNS